MGNYLWYSYESYVICKKESLKKKHLKDIFKSTLSDSQFKIICLNILQRFYQEQLQLETQENLRKSIAPCAYYQSNSLTNSILSFQSRGSLKSESPGHLPFTKSSMPQQYRQMYVLAMIKESYLFLDLTDCMQNLQAYESYMKNQILKDNEVNESFIKNKDVITKLQEELKSFNPNLIVQLQYYVKFCRTVKHDFQDENQRFLGKLCLSLQGQIMKLYENQGFHNKEDTFLSMLEDIKEVINILVMTVQAMYELKIQKIALPQENQYNFYNEMNIYTLVTSIFFQNIQFTTFIHQKMKECFLQRFRKYIFGPSYTNSEFITDYINLNAMNLRLKTQSQRNKLFSQRSSVFESLPIFTKTSKILRKAFEKHIPIFNLKIIYQLNKQMRKQDAQLKKILLEKHNIQINNIFDRQTELLIVRWLLRNNINNVQDICVNLTYSYIFLHVVYKIQRKGSCLTTFMQQIQMIVNCKLN